MMIKKPFGKKVITLILVIVLTVTPFSYVKAYTTDDLYIKLRDILYVLNGYGQNIPTAGIDDQIQELQDLFDSIFVDTTYSYVSGSAGLVTNRSFMDLLEEMASLSFSIPQNIMEGYYLSDQSGNIHHINGLQDDLTIIENNLSSLSMSDSQIVTKLNSIMSDILRILTKLTTISDTLTSILTTDNNIYNLETNFYNYIQNGSFKTDLDNAIDTISWNINNYIFAHAATVGGSYSNIIADENYGKDEYIYVPSSILSNSNSYLYFFRIPLWIGIGSDFNLSFELYTNNGIKIPTFNYYYNLVNYRYIDLYFYVDVIGGYNYYLKVISNYNLRGGNTSLSSYSLLPSSDIEYWTIKSYLDLHNLLLDYESVNLSELDQLKQQNQQFNNTLQNFNNLENQISTDFSNNLVTFNSNLTESQTLMSSLTTAVVWFSQQMDNVFNVSGSFKMLFILPMILGIALWFIGRGSFVLRSAGRRSEKKKE